MKKHVIFIAVFFGLVYAVQAQNLLIVEKTGKIFFWQLDGDYPSLNKFAEPSEHTMLQRQLFDAYFNRSSSTLFVTTDMSRLYKIPLLQGTPAYLPIDTERNPVEDVMYDSNKQHPVWLKLEEDILVSRDRKGIVEQISANSILCPSIKTSFFPGGLKSTEAFLSEYPESGSVLDAYPDDKWVILGQSETLIGYGRILVNTTKEGEPFQSTLLFHNRVGDKWNIFTLDEFDNTYVYDEVAVIQGMHLIKGARDALGNLMQEQPSGNWYFYLPGSDQLISSSLDPEMNILYATADTVFIVKGQNIYKAGLSSDGLSEPEKLLTIPESSVEIFRVYPIDFSPVTSQEEGIPAVSNYLLASAQEKAETPIPCRLYRTEVKQPCLTEIATIFPHHGIQVISAYPNFRKLAVWREDDKQTGSVILVDVDMPAYRQTISLPFPPKFGGYLVDDPEEGPLVLTGLQTAEETSLSAYSIRSACLEKPSQYLHWETVFLQGINVLRRGGVPMYAYFDGSNNQFFPAFRYAPGLIPFPGQFDDTTRTAFEQFQTPLARIWGNTGRAWVIAPQPRRQRFPESLVLFIYDKLKHTWTPLHVEGTASHIQVFDPWVLIQQAIPDPDAPKGPVTPTGMYSFYHLDRGEQFQWQPDEHTEVLGIWKDSILYRTADELFEAKIAGTDITGAQLVCQDPAIHDVHWAFIVP